MRLFVAVELDDAARAAIGAEMRRLTASTGDEARSLRFVRAEHLHLTLVFLGEVPAPRAAAVVGAMQIDIDHHPYTMALGGLSVFPARGAPRVLWLGVMQGAEQTRSLQAAVAARLEAAGVPRDTRPFAPHLTLARWRDRHPRRRPALEAPAERLASVHVDTVTLFESRLSQAGPTYTAHARARLCR